MATNETDNPYWKLPEKGATLEVLYKYDEESGKVVRITESHEDDARIVTQQSWEFYGERADEARKLVLAGKKSPLYYYMEKIGMELNILAPSVSLPKWRVKRHFKPEIYKKLKRPMLERYANALDVKVEDFDKID